MVRSLLSSIRRRVVTPASVAGCAGSIAPCSIGFVDAIANGFISGWAQRANSPNPISVLLYYDDAVCEERLADIYRPDVEAAGICHGRHGFKVALPRDLMVFNPEKFEVRCDDGTVLPRTDDVRRFLTCLHRLQGASGLDLLASPGTTRSFFLELTRNCNLRCVYCAVSQPWYEGKDMDVTDFDDLVQMIKARQVNTLLVNGHGETTTIHGWHHKIVSLADAGFRLSMISNFARLLTDEELAAMARISQIEISVDTHRPDVLRAVRRKVDLGNILINMANVTSTASKLGLPRPQFSWSCVVSDRVALDLADYVRFGLACGVRNFTLCNLTKYDDIKDGKNVRHVTTLPREDLKRFLDLLEQVRTMVSAAGGNLTIWSGLVDSIHQQLALQEVA